MAEYVVAARAEKIMLGQDAEEEKIKTLFLLLSLQCGASGKTRVSSFRIKRQLLNFSPVVVGGKPRRG